MVPAPWTVSWMKAAILDWVVGILLTHVSERIQNVTRLRRAQQFCSFFLFLVDKFERYQK